jgi:hypothetical protein
MRMAFDVLCGDPFGGLFCGTAWRVTIAQTHEQRQGCEAVGLFASHGLALWAGFFYDAV